MAERPKHGKMQDALIEDIHEAIDRHRVEVGVSVTYIDVVGCLERVKLNMFEEAAKNHGRKGE